MTKPLLPTLLTGFTFLLVACGQVVTPEPTRTPIPADTPTAVAAMTLNRSPTAAPPTYQPDTPTPTITPTPIVHVVQKGDTLQAIAFDFGVSVDALQRANGVENPQFLQVGQRLVIPVGEEPDQTTSNLLLPTPTPHPVHVQGVAFYETPVESLLGLGEIANTTGITLTNVQVQVTLLDAVNQPLLQSNTFVSMDVVPPGVRCPFSILFDTPPSDWVSYQVMVIRGQEAEALANAYASMPVVEVEARPSGPQFQVTGMVENATSGSIVDSVDIFVTTYDADGTITGFRRSTLAPEALDGGLPPGERRAFSLSLTTHHGVPDDFTVTALGHTAAETASGG